MNRSDITQMISYMQDSPAALKERVTHEVNITENIIGVLTWVLKFVDYYNKVFKNKKGEYRKPGWSRAFAIVGVVFSIGLELINLKKK